MTVQQISRENAIQAYKVFDNNLQCRGFQFSVGQEFFQEGVISLCNNGFHACVIAADCFNYYAFDSDNRVCKVLLWGTVDMGEGDKIAASSIAVVEEINWQVVLTIVNAGKNNTGHLNTGDWNTGNRNTGDLNTGDWNTGNRNTGDLNTGDWNTGHRNTGHLNTGDWNTGNRNTGHRNTGDLNTGDWNTGNRNTGHRNTGDLNTGDWNTGNRNTGHLNTGDWNTGDWNTGDWNVCSYETGFFNIVQSEFVRVFGKTCPRMDWESAYKPDWLYFNLTDWVAEKNMSSVEKKENPSYKTTGGYLKKYAYKEAFMRSFLSASKEEQAAVRNLPNFDEEIFFEISGIRLSDYGI